MPKILTEALRWSSKKIETIKYIEADLNYMFRFEQNVMIPK